jgi:predicted ATPase
MIEPAGRSNEIDRVRDDITAGRNVLVAGEMGVGKTALLKHVASLLRAADIPVTVITATSAASKIPFGSLSGFIDPADRTEPASQIAAATARLRRLGDDAPIVLFVDDAQHLDPSSIAVLHELIVSGEATVMASVRTSDPGPTVLSEMWRQAETDRFTLGPLDDDSIGEVVSDVLGFEAPAPVAASIVRRSGGNPLFARELARAQHEGVALTAQLVDLVGRRIDALSSTR